MDNEFIDSNNSSHIEWTIAFIKAIHDKTKIRLTFYSKQDRESLVRLCAPMDYGAGSRTKDKSDRFHLWDYESATSYHPLSLLPSQIINMNFLDEAFEPSEFISWTPNWIIKRDWGIHS